MEILTVAGNTPAEGSDFSELEEIATALLFIDDASERIQLLAQLSSEQQLAVLATLESFLKGGGIV